MEITSCEQYVLAELEAAQARVESLTDKNASLQARLLLAEERVDALQNAKPSRIEAYIAEYGRKQLFDDLTYANATPAISADGKKTEFRVWCEECLRDYGRPEWMSAAEFIQAFEPEFRKAYEKHIEEQR